MKKAFALALLMSTAAVGGSAYARSMTPTAHATGDIDIVYTNRHADQALPPDQSMSPSKATIAEAQADISKNHSLRAALLQRSVELNNVVKINEGNVRTTVYVQ